LSGGFTSGAVVEVVWSHFLIPGKSNRFAWDKEAAKRNIFLWQMDIFVY
jgi:hypothetical protein